MTYSSEADALAIKLAPGAISARMVRLAPGVNADFDGAGRLIGVEVLRAGERYDRAALEHLAAPTEFLTLAEAAKESGLSPATLRVQLHKGRLTGAKRGRDWVIATHELWNYLEGRQPRGRPPATRKGRQIRKRTAPPIKAG